MNDTIALIAPERDIDWTADFTWVHDYGRLRPLDSAAKDGRRPYQKTDGTVVYLDDAERDEKYQPSGVDGYLKRRYKPAQGHCLAETVEVALAGRQMRLVPGDAILRYGPGEFEIVKAEDYRRNYLAIAFERTAERPPYAFPDENAWHPW